MAELTEAERAAERDRASWQARRDALALGLHPRRRRAAVLAPGWPGVLGPVADRLTVAAGRRGRDHRRAGRPGRRRRRLRGRRGRRRAGAPARSPTAAGPACWSPAGSPPVPRDGWPDAARTAPAGRSTWSRRRPSCGPRWPGRSSGWPSSPISTPRSRWCATHPRVRAVTAAGDLVGADWAVGGQSEAPSSLVRSGRGSTRPRPSWPRPPRAAAELADELAAAREAAPPAVRRRRRRARGPAGRRPHPVRGRRRSSPSWARPPGRRPPRPSGTWPPGCAPSRPCEQVAGGAGRARGAAGRGRGRAGRGGALDRGARPAARRGRRRPAGGDRGAARGPHRRGAGPRAARPRGVAAPAGPAGAGGPRTRRGGPGGAASAGRAVAAAVAGGAETALAALATSLTAGRHRAGRRRLGPHRAGGRAAGGPRPGARGDRGAGPAHRRGAPRRGRPRRAAVRIEALEARAAEEYGVDLPTLVAEYGPARRCRRPRSRSRRPRRRGSRSPSRCPTTAPSRSGARPRPSATSPPSARSTRSRWRSSRPWRSGTASSPPSWRTSRPPAATCSPSSARSTSASTTSSPPPSPTSPREFEQVFATLFPGGDGRLVLTEPDDLLTTGVEVEARPPGKKVKRLSLLSGGERSLTAVALLVAIFRARPVAVLRARRGRGRAGRRQPRPAAHPGRAAPARRRS